MSLTLSNVLNIDLWSRFGNPCFGIIYFQILLSLDPRWMWISLPSGHFVHLSNTAINKTLIAYTDTDTDTDTTTATCTQFNNFNSELKSFVIKLSHLSPYTPNEINRSSYSREFYKLNYRFRFQIETAFICSALDILYRLIFSLLLIKIFKLYI